jgi:hypothetical protein
MRVKIIRFLELPRLCRVSALPYGCALQVNASKSHVDFKVSVNASPGGAPATSLLGAVADE